MPLLPSEHFLLWQQYAGTKRLAKLLEKPLTRVRWIAILMLQAFPARKAEAPALTREDALKKAIADGWGA